MNITVKNVNKSFQHLSNNINVLEGININIPKGSWISIVGPSGSGKSTLLNCISGLLKPDAGNVFYEDIDIYSLSDKEKSDFRRRTIGFVFQDFKLLPHYSVLDNTIMPLLYDVPKRELYEKATSILQNIGINKALYTRLPSGLSGGEKQRVAIARALIADADVLICDEPTGNLDVENRDKITDLLINLNKKGKTIIIVTHDMEVASRGSNIYHLHAHTLSYGGVSK